MVAITIRLKRQVHSPSFPTQRERDDESSLMHYRARGYDPRFGRFVQGDSSDKLESERHLYSYASNGPIRFGDPLGRASWDLSLLRRRANESTDAAVSLKFWEAETKPGGGIDTLMLKVIQRLPGLAVWPREYAQVRGEFVKFTPAQWSRRSRAALYRSLYSGVNFIVRGQTTFESRVPAETSDLTNPALWDIYIAGASWPGGDERKRAREVAVYVLIHELAHIAQKQRYEPIVALEDHFSVEEMQGRGKLFGLNPVRFASEEGVPEINAPFEPYAYYLQGQATHGDIQESVKSSRWFNWPTFASVSRSYGVGMGGGDTFRWDLARWVPFERRPTSPPQLAPPNNILRLTKY